MDFEIKLEKGDKLYRSFNTQTHIMGKNWFTLSPEESFGYGKYTYEYTPKEDLTLIDFTSIYFYNDFLSKLKDINRNIKIVGIETSYRNLLLFPLGFSDLNVYYEFAKTYINPPNIVEIHKISETIKTECQIYNNRARCSDSSLDSLIIDYIKDNYGKKYKGIIMRQPLPDFIQNGFQHSEVCLFDPNSVEPIKEIHRHHSGGQIQNTNQQYIQKKPLIKKSMALNIMNFLRDKVLNDEKSYSKEEIQYYKNHDYINDLDENYRDISQPINRKYKKTRKNRK